ncbi:unnamed protein product [Dibothriocephalus latus]|uniref:NADP-dependent oxidoreductase domain-containing protein n=1 Tax=Dibothriocephalus latus TaxID=60516 RepID=A0A3P7LLI6_DIBLA|nr:unnamed protein product [Dibothriocephalus latus]
MGSSQRRRKDVCPACKESLRKFGLKYLDLYLIHLPISFKSKLHEVEKPLLWAIAEGYRHIDCARAYQNEVEVGRALKHSFDVGTVKRDDMFITSKAFCNRRLNFYIVLKEGKEFSRIDLSVFDLENIPLEETWKLWAEPDHNDLLIESRGMEEVVEAGHVRSIGVSNFNKAQIDRILASCKIPPAVNQIEVSVNWLNQKLIDYCHSKGIQITAYSPFGSPGVMKKIPSPLEEDYVKKIALAHGKMPGQILLRHAVQRGLSVIANSSNAQSIKANFNIFDFELTKEEMEILNTSGRKIRVFTVPMAMNHPEYPFNAEF